MHLREAAVLCHAAGSHRIERIERVDRFDDFRGPSNRTGVILCRGAQVGGGGA